MRWSYDAISDRKDWYGGGISPTEGAEKAIGRGDLRTGQSSLGGWRPRHSGESRISMEPLKSSKAERDSVEFVAC